MAKEATPPRRSAPDGAEQEARRRQRLRSIAIALTLGGLVVLFYVVTMVRLGGSVAKRVI